ncbi:hypothetical protein DSAG12_02218 [Promethearchaeum syntrophicum]|uniref:Uncharacterized protein n=1 Tax=Promethearchaeum syntrophicum TaxID=2594042 RepID=A0A5B9DB65_9ARCH|nr:hypothetical protein [Candidatus Prometheoarchaeum syntrophicum]QEE16388.1 EAP30/Vps36 family protein [Candidatus Prometheoarchaeum syntrophicum]
MVKVPVGEKVEINLWDSDKKRGIAKYFSSTMDLVRAESEFELNPGDTAVVVESYDSFIVVVPEDDYTKLLSGKNIENIDPVGLNRQIYKILKERMKETGGILSLDELWSILNRTSIQNILDKKDLKKAINIKDSPFDRIKVEGRVYIALRPQENMEDIKLIVKFGREASFLTKNLIRTSFNWSDLRIERLLWYLIDQGSCRIENQFRTGTRYYFL